MEKIKLNSVFAILCLLFVFSNASFLFAKNNINVLSNSDKITAIEFRSDILDEALLLDNFTENLYYVVNGQKNYLNSLPDKQVRESNRWIGIWKTKPQGYITISVNSTDSGYTLSFTCSDNLNIHGWGMNLTAASDEYFRGIFERTVDGDQKNSWEPGITQAMDLRGQQIDMLIKPTVSLYCPFYISSRNYSLFVEGTWPGTYDFCKSDEKLVKIFFEGPQFSAIINVGQPAELIKQHSLRVGPTILPPKWTFGPWRWRDNHSNNETYYDGTPVDAPFNSEVVEDILMMKAFGIPCTVYWVDRPWAGGGSGYDDFTWDEKRFPNATEMIDWIHDGQMKFVLWIAPWVNGNMAFHTVNFHYNLKNKKGSSIARPLIDYSNPAARYWWQTAGIRKILLDGVDGFKLDRAEEIVPEDRQYTNFAGKTNREYRNEYPVDYVKATWEITRQIKGDDFVLMPRAGYTHSSRYGVFWAGDIGSTQEALRSAIIAQQRSAIIGYPIWGSDTGGYWQGDLDREVTARWLAFSCFSPIMEVGPTEDRGLWDMKKQPHYDAELIAIWRLYAIIHNNLIDYSYEQAKLARNTGMPIVRPLFMEWPQQPQAWQDWQTYTYGPDILVSAIWQKGKTKHRLYLPAGEKWTDAWTGKKYDGGNYIEVDAPMYKLPIFIRSQSNIDLGDLEALYNQSVDITSKKPDLKKLEKTEFSSKSN